MDVRCETCEFLSFDGETGEPVCSAHIDEDDYAAMLQNGGGCRYYRFYDEYKTVQKQN